jgi:hypothetical protein
LHRAADLDVTDAVAVLQPLDDLLLDQRRNLAQAARARIHHHFNRRALLTLGAGALDLRLAHFARQRRADLRDAVADLLRRRDHVGFETELDLEERAAFTRRRVDVAHAVDRVDDVLERLDDFVFDRLGRSARILHRDVRLRHADLGHLLYGEQPIREQAEHDQREHHHGREDGLVDAGLGDPHKLRPTRCGRALSGRPARW